MGLNSLRKPGGRRLAQGVAWMVWAGLLLAFVLLLAGCQPDNQEGDDGGAERDMAEKAEAVVDAEIPAGQFFTVGFTPDGHAFKGNPRADVIIEEFSSYQCPYCSRYFDETYPELVRRYVETGQVMYIFKDFPLSGQPQSSKAAEAARCAGEVGGAGAFWDMHDRLFGRQSEWSGRSDAVQAFKAYAGEIGVEQAAFDECLDLGEMSDRVQADSDEGASRGVRGTPTFFINGQTLVGAQPVDAFAAVIERGLAGESPDNAAQADSGGSPSSELLVPTPAAFPFQGNAEDDTLLALGDPEAPVTVVEYTDYQCPYCSRHFQETWPLLKATYIDTGRVYYVFRDFPLTLLHPQAPKAHEAARCAGQVGGEGAYWEMHDLLFENQVEWSNPEHLAIFKRYASQMGLDQGAFDACLDGDQQAAAVQVNQDEGLALGVTGTPTFFIDGYPFSGARPIEFFDQAITLAENGQLRDAIAEAIAQMQAQQEAQQPPPTVAPADVPVGDAPVKGDPDAPVTIVEYSDYQCPFCSRHVQETMPQLLENYVETGKVRYVFKDFPLTSIHPQAVKAAEAARCAAEQGGDGAYWDMHDRLFEGQGDWSGNSEHVAIFESYAGELGLNQTVFGECLDSERHVGAVLADLERGASFGVTGTPAFFINGQPLSGAQPYEVFVQVIETLLAGE